MSLARQLSAGLRTIFRKDAVSRDLDDEITHYLEMATRERMRAGMSRAKAERAARVEFGGVESTKELVRGGAWESAVETAWQDVRYAVRGLRRNPGFTVVAALTLALGIGANTAMFSIVNAIMLRPLPYRDADRLVQIWTDDARRGLHNERTAYRTVVEWREQNRTLTDVAFYSVQRATLSNPDGLERSRSAFVSGNLFTVLGVPALRGRTISPDDGPQSAGVAVISHALWLRRFGGDSNVVGKTLMTADNRQSGESPLRIIGVMPAGFYFPDKQTDFWTPATAYWRFNRESIERFPDWARRWTGVARIKPALSLDHVRADLANIGRRLDVTYKSDIPDFPGFGTNVVPMLDGVAGKSLQSALWLLLGSVGLVLLVACANVANLLLARGTTRQHEFALRRALGAGRGRITRQLIVESLVLATFGGALGVTLALFGTRLLSKAAAAQLPRADEISIDLRVLIFALLVSLVAGVVFGIVPSLRVSGADANQVLNGGGRASGTRHVVRIRGLLVIAECALAVVLLAGAGLLLRSLGQLHAVDPGFDPRHVLNVRVEFPPGMGMSAARQDGSLAEQARARAREQILDELTARIEAIPGVQSAGFIDDMFIAAQGNKSITIPGRAGDSIAAGQLNDGLMTPGFFRTMKIPLRRGRYLTRDDAFTRIRALYTQVRNDRPLVEKQRTAIPEPVVVNEAFAARFFPNEDPIGKQFCIDPTNKTYWYEIVGVVGNMHRQGLEQAAIPEFFGSYIPGPLGRVDLFVRTTGDPVTMAPTIRQVIRSSIPRVLIAYMAPADQQLGGLSAQRSFQTWLLTAFSVLALALAAVGIYGVVHYAVAERTREIGVRVALGASGSDVLRLVLTQGMRLPVAGIAIGLVGALGLSRTMAHLLFDTRPTDPVTYVGVALTLTTVALCACLLPARRASHVDPIVAIRTE
jgi:predicted permease